MNATGPVVVPEDVLEGIDYVRESGETNMCDRNTVVRIASREEFYATVMWITAHTAEYAEGIFRGFATEAQPHRRPRIHKPE